MALATRMPGAVTPLELIAVLAWWISLAAAVVALLRKFRRRNAIRRRLATLPPRRASTVQLGRIRGRACDDTASRPPARLPWATLELLCRYVDFRLRLELAAAELEATLSRLPHDRWRIEPYPLTGERRNTLLVLGETGVFVISATYAPGHWDDVIAVHQLARKIQLLLPGYQGAVQPAICHPFTSAPARMWHRPDAQGNWIGAWVVGGDRVIEWLAHFGYEHGLNEIDLERFDRLSKPNWLRPAIASQPTWPPVPDATAPTWRG